MMLHSLRPLRESMRNSASLALLTVAALASTMSLTGCGAEEAPVVVQAPPPPPPPPPAPKPCATLCSATAPGWPRSRNC